MANSITGIRIACSIVLLFCPAFSPAFYTLYIIAGVSDMIDGTVARKTGTVSEFGSKLDTVADLILVIVYTRHVLSTCLLLQFMWKCFFAAECVASR